MKALPRPRKESLALASLMLRHGNETQNSIILMMGTPNTVPLILGNSNPYNPLYVPVSMSFSIEEV